jgi:hypothetical protein
MKAYKYLSIEYSHKIGHKSEKEKSKQEFVTTLRLSLYKNKMRANGTLAIAVLRYSLGIINKHREEIQKLDRK